MIILLQRIQNLIPWVLRSFLIENHCSEFFPSFSGFDQKFESSIENLGNVFKSAFFVQQTLWEKSFCWKAYNFVSFWNWSRKRIDCCRSFVVKRVKLLCPCPDDIFAKNSFPWINYIATIRFSLWAKNKFGF